MLTGNKLENFARTNTTSIDANNDLLYGALFNKIGAPGGLIPRLLELEDKRFATAVERRTNSLTALLNEAFEPENDPKPEQIKKAKLIRDALNTVETATALNLLRDQINGLTDAGDSKIHIIGAWFGHIGQRWSQGNQCSATRAMRARCERKAECTAGETAGAIDAKSLCGFDPAPVARGKARGLVVRYTCEYGGREFWDELAGSPLINPVTNAKYKKAKTIVATLRSTTMKLSCSFPVAK